MVGPRAGRGGGESLLNGDRVLVWEEETVL